MNTIVDLWNGRAGLAKTYWLWGVLSGIPIGLALSLVTPGSNLAIVAVLVFVTYYVIVHVGIWRAASQYQGPKTWAILAKFAVVITPACLVIGTLAAIIIPATHQPSRQGKQTIPATPSLSQPSNPSVSSAHPPELPHSNPSLPELDCEPTGEPSKWIDGKEYTPVKCKNLQ